MVRTRAEAFGFELVVDAVENLPSHQVFGALLQYPDTHGEIRDLRPLIDHLHGQQALACVAADLLGLLLLTPPGELGADVVFGSAQRFGVPMGYGGPHAAFFATRDEFKRAMPGRIIGVSKDARGNLALRMALQTREQHIRREKANSNICTAQVLLANIAGFYAVYHGPQGLKRIAQRVHRLTAILAEGLARKDMQRVNQHYFDTLTPGGGRQPDGDHRIGEGRPHQPAHPRARPARLEPGRDQQRGHRRAVVEHLPRRRPRPLGGRAGRRRAGAGHSRHPGARVRLPRTPGVQHPPQRDRDAALPQAAGEQGPGAQPVDDPLGSCTMKLNATSEMIPITWPEFAAIHPFAPLEQAQGYQAMIAELEEWLRAITGFDAICMQPNSGAQGEYAGLLAIRKYHESRGEAHRTICLIPASAHGTNPASAQMASMRVVIVECDKAGNVDLDDLKAKAAEAGAQLSCLMATYPSTHGVYEEGIREICEVIHAQGGQVYMDGANLNAQVGLARPADIGADVSHMNLHKTFCIPTAAVARAWGRSACARTWRPSSPTTR